MCETLNPKKGTRQNDKVHEHKGAADRGKQTSLAWPEPTHLVEVLQKTLCSQDVHPDWIVLDVECHCVTVLLMD